MERSTALLPSNYAVFVRNTYFVVGNRRGNHYGVEDPLNIKLRTVNTSGRENCIHK